MNRIRVLEVIDKTFLGGGQINLLSLVDSFPETEFEVSVCSAASGPLADEIRRRRIPYYPVDMPHKLQFKTIARLKEIILGNSFDIVHAHGGVAGFYTRCAAGKKRSSYLVHTQHGIHYLHYRNPFLRILYIHLERWLSGLTDAVIFVSESDLETAMKYKLCAPSKANVIKNGIDAEKVAAAAVQAETPADLAGRTRPVIGTVARLHYQKNIPLLLFAADILRRRFPGLTVVIAGDGPERSRLEAMCRRLKIENNVLFLGERRDIPAILAELEVFVLSSRWEGMPYALLEAGAVKRPVVATAVEGIREVIEDGRNGHLVPSGNAEALAEEIRLLLENRKSAEKCGEFLHQDVIRWFSLSRTVEKTRQLYIRLSRGSPGGR